MNCRGLSYFGAAVLVLLSSFHHQGYAGGSQWVSLGPAPIENTAKFSSGPVTGRVSDIAIDPNRNDHWLIAGASGGVWETINGGASWAPRTDDMPTQNMGAIAFAPSNSEIVYGGTGESVWNQSVGLGVIKSGDGGRTWTHLESTQALFQGKSFSDIKVDPSDQNHLIATTTHSFTREVSDPQAGLFRSTDGGESWINEITGEATDLAVVDTDFSRRYSAIGRAWGDPRNGVYRWNSTNGGWDRIFYGPWYDKTGGVGRIELALSASNPDILYVVVQDAIDSNGHDNYILGMWRTENAWAEKPDWTEININPITNDEGDILIDIISDLGGNLAYHLDVIVDPKDENIVYVGGLHLLRWTGGNNPQWQNISIPRFHYDDQGNFHFDDPGIHVDQHTLAWATNNTLVVGNDGGVYSTSDGGANWKNHNTNLSITQFYHGSVHPTQSNFVMGGSQDNGTEVTSSGDNWKTFRWKQIFWNDGGANVIASDTNWAYSSQWLKIYRSMDAGQDSTIACIGIKDACGHTTDKWSPYPPMEKCPHNDDIFITGTNELWKTTDFFSSDPIPHWRNDTSTASWWIESPDSNFLIGGAISAIAFSMADIDCQTYAFGSFDGRIGITHDGGATWWSISPPTDELPCPDFPSSTHICYSLEILHDLAFHPQKDYILYAAYATFGPSKIFKLSMGLSQYLLIDIVSPPGLEGYPAMLATDPLKPDYLYVGTSKGIWVSPDEGFSWTHMGPETGMPNVPISDMETNSRGEIYAFTFGRGTYKLVAHAVRNFVGDDDNLQPGDKDDKPSRSIDVLKVLDRISSDPGQQPTVDLDVGGTDRPVGLTHYFSAPGFSTESSRRITSAILKVRMRAEHVLAYTDVILYDEAIEGASGNPLLPFIAITDLLGREPIAHEIIELEIDLAKVPVRLSNTSGGPGGHFSGGPDEYRNLIPFLFDESFNLIFSDDVAIDYSELEITYVVPSAAVGDLDGNGKIDEEDLDIILCARNTKAYPNDPRDVDSDGRITALDARKLVQLCTLPQCAIQ